MGRLQRVYSTTGCYHIMLRGNERKRIFLDDEDRRRFLLILMNKKAETDFSVYSFCLMDNHVHMVFQDHKNNMSNIMKGIATSYAMFFNNKYERVGHVFQDRYRSEPIEDERYLMAVIRYIHNNPVKAGIIEKLEQYQWSSYQYYLDPIKIEPKLVDSLYILGMISEDSNQALQEFERFSTERDKTEYMDDDETVRTLEQGRVFLEEYLKKNWQWVTGKELIKNVEIRTQVIRELKSNTRLSVRKIAELMGINRGMVQEVQAKIDKDLGD